MGLLSKLYGRKTMPFQTLNLPVGTQQPYHSDSVHAASFPERFMCGVWVALEDINLKNGPLMYFPGTHKWPFYFNEHLGKPRDPTSDKYKIYGEYVDLWRELIDVSGAEYKLATMKKGQAVIWAANLLHGGSVHVDQTLTRHSQVTHYFFEGCSYYVPVNSEPHRGEVYYHKFKNIADGLPMTNMCNGQVVSQRYIDYCDVTESI